MTLLERRGLLSVLLQLGGRKEGGKGGNNGGGERNRKIGGDTEGESAKKRSFYTFRFGAIFSLLPRSGRRRQKCKHRAKERIPGSKKRGVPETGVVVYYLSGKEWNKKDFSETAKRQFFLGGGEVS